ncbi:MAG: F0F1 ATP synthase subunit B [Chloroflexi bacterium]|nr:F0F1 ATP synthase subunit B [Chloroflexota bacterium]
MAQLGLNLGYLLVQIICFFIILVVVYAWIVKPLLGMLEKRRMKLEQGLEDARIAAEARANAEKDAAKIVAEAQTKSAQTVREATERAELATKDVRAAAEAEVAKARQSALAEVEEERNRMLADLRGQVAALSIAAAQKLIGEAMDAKRQHALLDEFFSGVKSGKLVLLEGADLTGDSAEVTSALPLSKEEQASVKNNVLDKMGAKTNVEFRVDPQILGGLVIRVGDKVLDGSVSGQLEDLRKSLK